MLVFDFFLEEWNEGMNDFFPDPVMVGLRSEDLDEFVVVLESLNDRLLKPLSILSSVLMVARRYILSTTPSRLLGL